MNNLTVGKIVNPSTSNRYENYDKQTKKQSECDHEFEYVDNSFSPISFRAVYWCPKCNKRKFVQFIKNSI